MSRSLWLTGSGRVTSCPTPILLRPYLEVSDGVGWGERIAKACGRWNCVACGIGKLIEVRRHIQVGINHWLQAGPSGRARFLTVTYPNSRDLRFEDPEDFKKAARDFRNLIGELRVLGYQVEYCKACESTKTGRIHIHAIVVGDYLPKCTPRGAHKRGITNRATKECYCTEERPCIQRIAHRFGMGWVDIRVVRNPRHGANYLSKYITKTSRYRQYPRYARRYSYSRGFAPVTLADIHQEWVDKVLAEIDIERKDQGLPPRPVVLWWEPELPHLRPAELIRSLLQDPRGPPVPADSILKPATGELLPIPY